MTVKIDLEQFKQGWQEYKNNCKSKNNYKSFKTYCSNKVLRQKAVQNKINPKLS